jgi:aspartate-semialdehyde dehydrogenase
VEETRKIMHADEMAISATCVRVPIFISHSEAIHIEFSEPMPVDTARRILAQAPGVRVLDDPTVSLYPQPWFVAGSDDVFVGRIRQDSSHSCGLAIWVVADNLRKGAALNTVQIAETMIERGWI